jgi:hypothetical protein
MQKALASIVSAARPYSAVIGMGSATVLVGLAARELFFTPYRTPGLPPTPNVNGFAPTMTRQEAQAILNVQGQFTHGDIQQKHRTMMALHHPDKGGSLYIATKINEARDFLSLGIKQ